MVPIRQEYFCVIYNCKGCVLYYGNNTLYVFMKRVSYQGEEGAYGYTVAKRLGEPVKAMTFDAALQMVISGNADQAVIPVENSRYGEVADSNDAICSASNKLHITGEWYEPIHHCLIGNHTNLDNIRQVYSHYQALGQCKKFIKEHNLQQIQHYDTAASVSLVKEMRSDTVAAIAGREAAELYGMEIIKSGISDDEDNTTRFLIIDKNPVMYNENTKYKTTMAFTLHHKKGSLHTILNLMRDVNLTRIISRPIRDWKYVFFVDFEGHIQQHKTMVDAVQERCLRLHLLGSYEQGS